MKINADERNFTTIDEIADDMIITLGGWQDEKRNDAIEFLSCYISDWYHDYELTEAEFDEIKEIIADFFGDDDED